MKMNKDQMAQQIASKMGAKGISETSMMFALTNLRKEELEKMHEAYFPAISALENDLGLKTCDAYSYDAYGREEWLGCIHIMTQLGFNDEQIEAVLRSKWMRWAGDSASTSHPTSRDFEKYMDNYMLWGRVNEELL